jgi:hypothetical protein
VPILLTLSFAIAVGGVFTVGLLEYIDRTNGECPALPGDRVAAAGKVGQVRMIQGGGAWSASCKVGVIWEDGTSDMIEAWRLEVVE